MEIKLVLDGKLNLFLKHLYRMRQISLFLFIHLNLLLCGQVQSFKVRDINTDSFPQISGRFWVRNPVGLDPNRVHFLENEKEVEVDFGKRAVLDSLPPNKRLVFLIVNGPNPSKFSNNIELVLKAIPNAEINPGDQVDVVSFSCLQKSGKVLLGKDSGFAFTDDKSELKRRLLDLEFVSRSGLRCQPISPNQSDINFAIYKTLEELEKVAVSIPTSIVVVGDNQGVRRSFTGESPVDRAKRLNIAVFSVAFPFDASLDMHSEVLAEESFGIFYNSISFDVAVQNLEKCISEIIPRSQGCYYPFKYNSSLKKEGLAQTVIIRIDRLNETGAFIVNTPGRNIWELAQENPILAAVFAVLFLLLCGLVLMLVIIQQKKKKQTKQLEEEKMARIKAEQKAMKDKLSGSEAAMEQLRQQQEQQTKEQTLKLEQDKKNQKRAAALIKMRAGGRLAYFEFYQGGESWQIEISEPEFKVGRGADCHWILTDSNISRNHFKVVFSDNSSYILQDLQSSNGVFVNNRKVDMAVLNHGDVVDFGEARAIFYM